MRKIVSVLIVAFMALSLVGCGGGDQPAETTAPDTAAVPVAAAPAPEATIGDRSVNESATFEPFPQGAFVPADLKAAIDAKRPTLIYFYNSSYTSEVSRDIIDVVRDENRGSVDLFTYDISKYTAASPAGVVSVDPALATDPAAIQAVELARQLGVSSAPFTVITDNQGYITWKFRGLVDQVFLEREVQRAAP